jgi:para-aminobenzoate synthetase component I
MNDIIGFAGERYGTHIERLDIKEPFINIASGFAHMPGTVLLMSGGGLDSSRYHILGIKPWLTFSGHGRRMTLSSEGRNREFEANPFDAIRAILNSYHINSTSTSLPLTSGLMGYLSYDLKDCIEELPRTSIDDLGLPSVCLFAPSIILIHDKIDDSTWLCASKKNHSGNKTPDLMDDFKNFEKSSSDIQKQHLTFTVTGGFKPNMKRQEYLSFIEKIKKYIISGDVYQVNFAQRFQAGFSGDPFELFKTCYRENPAPFFAYINAGDHQVISTSPERFIYRNGSTVETRPIKGTRPRGKNINEDQALKKELEESDKDDAELSMIVDLMRNDLGKVCECGSVNVRRHKKIEEYRNVFHMISIVEGKLDSKYDSVDLIRATFPGGSITGCPRIRAMEIIDELEPNRRHVYTGSIGYLSFHDTMDLSIAIRTAVVYNDKMFFSVGGGIVYDSGPSEEFTETLHKGKTLMNAMNKNDGSSDDELAWINGMIKPLDQTYIKVSDLGFQYGYGFFETIRFSDGAPCYLKEHMARFNKAWDDLFHTASPDLSWGEIINQVIKANRLKNALSSVKIMASWGTRLEPPYDHTIIVTARAFENRLSGMEKQGLQLITFPYPRETPLASHKSLNYAYYYLAGKWAKNHGADEALIMNPDKSISETNTANIIAIKEKSAYRPLSAHVLPGIMEQKVFELLSLWGYNLENKRMKPEDLIAADHILITNSLNGAMPVRKIDDFIPGDSKDICKRLNDVVLL